MGSTNVEHLNSSAVPRKISIRLMYRINELKIGKHKKGKDNLNINATQSPYIQSAFAIQYLMVKTEFLILITSKNSRKVQYTIMTNTKKKKKWKSIVILMWKTTTISWLVCKQLILSLY